MKIHEIFEKIGTSKQDVTTMTINQLAKFHQVPLASIQKELDMGIKVEKEHTKDKTLAKEIALDHLKELPDYYSRLKKMENE